MVNDASTDNTRQRLASLTVPELRVVHNDSNMGFSRAVNAGVAHAKGKVLGLLNNDFFSAETMNSAGHWDLTPR